ncbi:MAG TPA: YceI family protein [Verrucomicrobiales bacterium]|nr:YceI family protein [Verrucomicrobiales bacterium]
MKTHTLASALAAAALISLTGCSDPAEDVHKSSASAPAENVTASTGNGREFVLGPGTTIGFVGSKVTGSHEGGFTNVTGTIAVSDGRIVGSPEFQIDMASTWSDNDRLTGHLKSPDFFDVANHPTSTFTVATIEEGTPTATVTGNLALHGVTKSIAFPATINVGADAVNVQAEFAINRKDFGITYPGRPDDLIRDNVVIKLSLAAVPK